MISRSLMGKRPYVWSQDPALNKDAVADWQVVWDQFLRTGNLELLPLKEGEKLTVFEVAPLTRKQMTRVMNYSALEQLTEIIAYSLKEVRNYEIDGTALTLEFQGNGDDRKVTPAMLDKLFDPSVFAELGTRVLVMSQLDPTQQRG